ncbi:MAG: Crp/Fnr family transcriptional regulator [Caldilineaceae bacterium]
MANHSSDLDRLMVQLRTVPIFRGLDSKSLEQLARSAIWREYATGVVIFLEGDSAPTLYYIQTGWVKIVKMAPDGREQILYFWGPGDTFGGIGVFINRPMPASAIALEPTGLWLLRREAIVQLLTTQPAMALQVIESMANRMHELMALVADLSLHTVTERFARLLLEEAEGDILPRRRWATQTELAARLGTVPDVLSRALRSLVDGGLIAMDRHEIRILQREALETLALVKT